MSNQENNQSALTLFTSNQEEKLNSYQYNQYVDYNSVFDKRTADDFKIEVNDVNDSILENGHLYDKKRSQKPKLVVDAKFVAYNFFIWYTHTLIAAFGFYICYMVVNIGFVVSANANCRSENIFTRDCYIYSLPSLAKFMPIYLVSYFYNPGLYEYHKETEQMLDKFDFYALVYLLLFVIYKLQTVESFLVRVILCIQDFFLLPFVQYILMLPGILITGAIFLITALSFVIYDSFCRVYLKDANNNEEKDEYTAKVITVYVNRITFFKAAQEKDEEKDKIREKLLRGKMK